MKRCGAFVLVVGAASLLLAGNAFAMPIGLSAPPSNDNFANRQAVTLSGNTATVGGTTVEATSELGEPGVGSSDRTVWYSWTAAQSGMLSVGTCGSSGIMAFASLYTGATLNSLTPVSSALNPGCSGGQSGGLQSFVVTGGVTYQIQVVGYFGAQGSFNLALAYSNQFPLTVNKTGSTGKGRVTSNPAGIDCGVQCTGATQSYANGSSITLTAEPASGTSEVGTWSEPGCSGTSCTFTLNGPKTVTVTFNRIAGPPNDNFASGTTLAGASVSQNGTNVDATTEPNEPNAGNTFPTVWYRWTAPSSGLLTVSTCTADFFAVSNVYRGPALADLAQVAFTTSPGCPTGTTYTVTGGLLYHIQVGGYLGVIGNFTLELTFSNEFPLALTKSGTGHGVVTSTPAGISCGVSCTNQTSIFTAGSTVTLSASHPSTTSFDGWTGAPGCSIELECEVTMSAARTVNAIFTRVSGPVNDNFVNRTLITAGTAVTPSNVDASRESGEPGPASEMTLWYRWNAPSPGRVEVSSCGGSTWSTVAAYTGGSVDALTPISAPATPCPGGQSGNRLSWQVTTGQTSALQLAGYLGALGNLRLAVAFTPTPRCRVPKLAGKTLQGAKTALTRANCKIGRVTKAYSVKVKKGKVIRQSPAAGRRLVKGARVNVTLSKGRRP